jgi:hypothetical protein
MNYSAQFPERKILDDSQEEILKGIFEGILRNENSGRFLDWIKQYDYLDKKFLDDSKMDYSRVVVRRENSTRFSERKIE